MIAGRGDCGAIVWTPEPAMSKSIVLVAPTAASESRIAWRSEPGPLSAVIADHEGRQQGAVFHPLDPGPEPEDRPAERGGRCGPSRAATEPVRVPEVSMSKDHGSGSGAE